MGRNSEAHSAEPSGDAADYAPLIRPTLALLFIVDAALTSAIIGWRRGESMPSNLAKVNRTKVVPELLLDVIKAHSEVPAEDRPVLEARIFRISQLLSGRGLKGRRHNDVLLAIQFRLEALARLIEADATRGWTMPGLESGVTSIDIDLLTAAAQEPLIEGPDGHAAFDADSFQKRVLKISETNGQA